MTDTILSFVTTPDGKDEAEFNEWLEKVHFRELVDYVDGVVSVARYQLLISRPADAAEKIQPFIAVYTLDKPAAEVAENMSEVIKAGKITPYDWSVGAQVYFATYVSTIS